MANHTASPQRIPLSLQSVFLASNRGDEVLTPPPSNAASRNYFGFGSRKVNAEVPVSAPPLISSPVRLQRMFSFVSPKKEPRSSPVKKHVKRIEIAEDPATPFRVKPITAPKKSTRLPSMSPQSYLDALMSNRGYCTERIPTIETAYYNAPTQLQKASYHCFLINVVKSGDVDNFTALMAAGLSPNPANHFGESLCHLICRLGNNAMLNAVLECGATLEVCDDFGRTPLHDACWAAKPSFDVIDTIMTAMGKDSYHLFTMVDKRGSTPLSYIRQEHWAEWMQFLVSKKDVYWPSLDKSNGKKAAPAIAREAPQSRCIPDPENALTTELATMVASGSISPMEARLLIEDSSESYSSDEDCEDCWDEDDDDDDSEDDSTACSDDDLENCSISEAAMHQMFSRMVQSSSKLPKLGDSNSTIKEMAHILECLNAGGRQPISWSR